MTKIDWEYDEKCETSYEEVCHGYGYDKKCDQVPKEMCHQVPVKVEKQVKSHLRNKIGIDCQLKNKPVWSLIYNI